MISLIVSLCQVISGAPVCHEELVSKAEVPAYQCMMSSQVMVAQWKEQSKFSGDQWQIESIICIEGDYLPKRMI